MGQQDTGKAGIGPGDAAASAAPARPYRERWWGQFGFVDARTGKDVLPKGRRAQAILAMAASRPGTPILRSDLATMFWGDRGEEQARASLRQSLAELRELATEEPALAIDQRSVTALPEQIASRDEQLAALMSGDSSGLLALLERGDGSLAGLDGLSGPFDDWLAAERARSLEALVLATVQGTADGRADQAQQLVNRVQGIDPLDERLARAGFDADAAAGDRASLERRLRSLKAKLRDELGVEPSPATIDAYRSANERIKGSSAPRIPPSNRATGGSKRPLIAAGLAGLIVIVAAALLLWRADGSGSSRDAETIAVVPFTAAADQNDLADGFAEEIVSRLSRNPRIAALGRNSARLIGDDPSSAIALGRELRVEHLLTGTLTNRNERLTIVARLIRTSDGEPVWNQSYEGTTSELVSLFNRIGTDVSQRVGAGALPEARSHPPKQEAAQLYYRARGLMRGGEPANVTTAVELLRQSVRLDPEYAAAWSLLGMATRTEQLQHLTPEGDPNSILIPQAYARRGLELAPNSAEANLAMADTLAEDPRSLPYALRAAELDPNNGLIWYELAEKYEKAGDFRRQKEVLDRAARVDPLWSAVVLPATYFNWNIGQRALSMSQLQRLYRYGQPQPYMQHMLRGDLAYRVGDFSKALQEFTAAAGNTDATGRVWADSGRGAIFYNVGLFAEARPLIAFKAIDADWDMFEGRPPSEAAIDIGRKHPFYAWNMQERNYFLLRLLVNGRRFADVATLYDRRFKSPDEFMRTPRGHEAFLNDAVPVMLALRQVGRAVEADRIQAIARREIDKRYAAGIIPAWYEVLAAQHFALAGEKDRAIAALERASRLGWLSRSYRGLPNIHDEPGFRPLAGDPRFEGMRTRMERIYARERSEVLAVLAR